MKCARSCLHSELGGPDPLQDALDAARRALKVADERSKENVALRAENERLRAALREMFLLACASNDIRPDSRQMRETGKLLASYEKPR